MWRSFLYAEVYEKCTMHSAIGAGPRLACRLPADRFEGAHKTHLQELRILNNHKRMILFFLVKASIIISKPKQKGLHRRQTIWHRTSSVVLLIFLLCWEPSTSSSSFVAVVFLKWPTTCCFVAFNIQKWCLSKRTYIGLPFSLQWTRNHRHSCYARGRLQHALLICKFYVPANIFSFIGNISDNVL